MTEEFNPEDPVAFRRVLGHFASGITVVAAQAGDRCVGFTCQSFTSVSLDPPLIAFFVRLESSAWKLIREAGTFAVSVLSHDQQNIARIFGIPGADKFRDLAVTTSPNGSPLIDGAIAWLDCDVEQVFSAGDHDGVIGRVTSLAHVNNASPLLYFRGGYGTFKS